VDGSGNAWLAGNTDDQLDGNTNAGGPKLVGHGHSGYVEIIDS